MKKKFIIGGIFIVVIASIVAAILLLTNKKITISFDTSGGEYVSAVNINKGGSIILPETEKEGFIFEGWYLENQRVTNSTKFDKDVTLKAKWISEEAKTFTVTFNSDGGSKVDNIIVECGKELLLPNNPTKSGYTFLSWIDKNETPIYDKALLACEDITLKANWEKEEVKQETKKKETKTTETVKQKSYKCPSGYTLDGTKCTKTENVIVYCSSSTDLLINGYCYYARKDVVRCGYEGVYAYSNSDHQMKCFYDDTGDQYMSQTSCENSGNYWIKTSNTSYGCYSRKEELKNSCDSTWYFIDAHQIPGYGTTPGIVDGCYARTGTLSKCNDGYTLSNNQCIKTIDATYE